MRPRGTSSPIVAVGFVFGAVQFVLGFFSVGPGEGCYAPLGLAAGPLTVLSVMLRNAAPAFFGLPLLWSGYGLLVAWCGRRKKATVYGRTLLIAHNVVGLLLVSPWLRTDYSDWGAFPMVWPVATICLALYAAGQWAFWQLLPLLDERRPTTAASRS
jgi:hypothetical protein